MSNGRRQPSCGGTSRMTRECQVRFCERLGVKFPGPTRQFRPLPGSALTPGCQDCPNTGPKTQEGTDHRYVQILLQKSL